jgi:hypothetical protein
MCHNRQVQNQYNDYPCSKNRVASLEENEEREKVMSVAAAKI